MDLSLGRPIYESYAQDPLCQAVECAWDAGIVNRWLRHYPVDG